MMSAVRTPCRPRSAAMPDPTRPASASMSTYALASIVVPPCTVYPRTDGDPRTGSPWSSPSRRVVGEVVGHAVQHDHRVDVAEKDAVGYLNHDWGIVEDGAHPGANQPVGDRLGVAGWDGDDRQLDPLCTNNC